MPVPDWALSLFPDQPLMFERQPWPPYSYKHIHKSLYVICSARAEADGKRWAHVSCSYRNKLPSWEEMRLVKDTFIGRDKKAIIVLPPEAEHVNIHPYVMHLWHCLDEDPLPDFRINGQI
jgi:hypothetical protein